MGGFSSCWGASSVRSAAAWAAACRLELGERITLPPGRVQVTIVPIPELPANDPFWQRMQALWAAQRGRGHVPRSAQEVEDERQAVREEWENRMRRIEEIQTEAARAR